MSFALDLKRLTDQADDAVQLVVKKIMFDLSDSLVDKSPVGDAAYWKSKPPAGYVGGHFKGNWQLGVDYRPNGELPGVDRDGGETKGRIHANVPNDAAGFVYWLANNVPYAQRLEHGHSRQAPLGLVGITVAEFQQTVERAAAAVRGAR